MIKKVSIGGITLDIMETDCLGNEDEWGSYHSDGRRILLNKMLNLTNEDKARTIIHELHHAALDISGISHIIEQFNLEEGLVRNMDNIFLPAVIPIIKRYL
jgi:hypothetical protein